MIPSGSNLGPEGRYSIPMPSELHLCKLGAATKNVIASVSGQGGRFALHTFVRKDEQEEVVSILPLPADDEAGKRDIVGADVDGDGVSEIVACEQHRNHVQILAFDEDGQLVDAYRFKVFETHSGADRSQRGRTSNLGQPRHALVQDVTGDGRNHLVLQVHDRIIIYPQD